MFIPVSFKLDVFKKMSIIGSSQILVSHLTYSTCALAFRKKYIAEESLQEIVLQDGTATERCEISLLRKAL